MRFPFAAASVAALALLLGGCAAPVMTDPATAGNHPANPDAPGTPFAPPSQTLAITANPSATTLPADTHDHAGPGAATASPPVPGEMDMEGMKMPGMSHGGMSHGGMSGMHDMAGMNRSAETPATAPAVTPPSTQASAYYTCPMHPEVHADKPGNCPICGMKLVKKSEGSGK